LAGVSFMRNTAVGFQALLSNRADENTATGARALRNNEVGTLNTANGFAAMLNNTSGTQNTAIGSRTMHENTTASNNTATGFEALFANRNGEGNTAIGVSALHDNLAFNNTAIGFEALFKNRTGTQNTASGGGVLHENTHGNGNTATGTNALFYNKGDNNTAIGTSALLNNRTGSENIAVGYLAGLSVLNGSANIHIGNTGSSNDDHTTRIGGDHIVATFIGGISGVPVQGNAVVVDANGQLGTVASAARFKKEIRSMDTTSEAILAFNPVTFQYKSDSKGTPQFGLVAEEVEKVNPDLVVRDGKGEIYTVRYDAVNVMLLNEFLKEHKKVEQLEGTIASLAATVKEQAAQIQTVNARLEMSRLQVAENN
jgi:hypothetical protein